jgi:hypothetical protein
LGEVKRHIAFDQPYDVMLAPPLAPEGSPDLDGKSNRASLTDSAVCARVCPSAHRHLASDQSARPLYFDRRSCLWSRASDSLHQKEVWPRSRGVLHGR